MHFYSRIAAIPLFSNCIPELQKISNKEALTATDLQNKKAGIKNPKL